MASISPPWRDTVADVDHLLVVDSDGACEIIVGTPKAKGHRPTRFGDGRFNTSSGRKRMYEVEAVIAYVRQRYDEAPVRQPPVSRRRSAASEIAA